MYEEVALVLGLHVNGLGTIRSLAMDKEIPILGLGKKNSIGGTSKFLQSVFEINEIYEEDAVLEILLDLNSRYQRIIPFPTGNDYWVRILAKHKSKLGNFVINYHDDVDLLMSKQYQYRLASELGIPCPEHAFVNNAVDVELTLEKLDPPFLIKPQERNTGKEAFRNKIASTQNELKQILQKHLSEVDTFLVSEIIPGPDSNLYTFGSYAQDGQIIERFFGRKLTQIPSGFGVVGTSEVVDEIPIIRQMSAAMLQQTNYTGISQIEFKLDPRDNQYKLMEMNPRSWMWVYLATKTGRNLPLTQYYCETGKSCTTSPKEIGRKKRFIFGNSIAYNVFRERKFNSLPVVFSSLLKGSAVFAIFSFEDIMPFIRICTNTLKMTMAKIRRTLRPSRSDK
jgi:predicted ATP-grasp superfamily ATP-dependent carboligase